VDPNPKPVDMVELGSWTVDDPIGDAPVIAPRRSAVITKRGQSMCLLAFSAGEPRMRDG
jgi:hypothetical protein